MFKVTSPKQMEGLITDGVINALKEFEELLSKEKKGQCEYSLEIERDLSISTCNMLEILYREAGWSKVECYRDAEVEVTTLRLSRY